METELSPGTNLVIQLEARVILTRINLASLILAALAKVGGEPG